MNHNKEWIIQYHGNLQKALQGSYTKLDIINEKYAIIKISEQHIPYLRSLVEIEEMERSVAINQVKPQIELDQLIGLEQQRPDLTGKGVTVGWLGHQMKNNPSSMDLRIGHGGIAPASELILVNWQQSKFYTADLIRVLRSMINKLASPHKPFIIYIPFDISKGAHEHNNLVRTVVSHMMLYGKMILVSSLDMGNEPLEFNLALDNEPIFTTCPGLTVGILALTMEWGIVKKNKPWLYGQKLRTYYIKNILPYLKKKSVYGRNSHLNEPLKRLFPPAKTDEFRSIDMAYEFAPEDAIIDAFIIYNRFHQGSDMVMPPDTTLYTLDFQHSGIRGPIKEIKRLFTENLGKTATASLPFILGNEPLNIRPADFESLSILKQPANFSGKGTLIGIIDTGIDYTHPAFIDNKGQTRIVSIWDQTIGTSSPYGYGTVYDSEEINAALKSPNPLDLVPHEDEWGHGTILAGIAAGSGEYREGSYRGVAPEAQILVVKLKPASSAMQDIYYSRYNPLGFSALDVVLAIEFLADLAELLQKPISICLPIGTNSGSHDGTNIINTMISNYAITPGVCMVLAAGEEANKEHHASGDLNQNPNQTVTLEIPKGQGGFIIEIQATFGDRLEASLIPPQVEGETPSNILLNSPQTYHLSDTSSVWSGGSRFDIHTGSQVIKFRLVNPQEGNWLINIRGITVAQGIYHIWLPKTGMILPGTVLSPSSPFVTVYDTGTAKRVITAGCYDKRSLTACSSSGRGFTSDNRVSPDFVVEGVDILGPLPYNQWGRITGTSPASAITVGVAALVYESQNVNQDVFVNTTVMKTILVDKLKREPTLSYPNPSSGYGLLDVNSNFYD